jgi:hypothetical protein
MEPWEFMARAHKTTYTFEEDRWAIVARADYPDGNRRPTVQFFKNGNLVRWVNEYEELQGYILDVHRVWAPGCWPVFRLAGRAGAGHHEVTHFYGIRNGELIQMLKLESGDESGGPVFRDLDGDGTCEWMFDNFNHYEGYYPGYRDDGRPDKFWVYKLQKDGTLALWRTLPNPKHIWLQRPAGNGIGVKP